MNCIKSSFLALGAVLLVTAQAGEGRSNFEIVSLSNRADLVSGGDALLEVRVPKNVPLNQVSLRLNGRVVTGAFRTHAAARTLRGVVTDLVDGDNEFVAEARGRGHAGPHGRVTITNHPIGGPVLLGPPTPARVCPAPRPPAAPGETPGRERRGRGAFAPA